MKSKGFIVGQWIGAINKDILNGGNVTQELLKYSLVDCKMLCSLEAA
jgi:hypothetical protein